VFFVQSEGPVQRRESTIFWGCFIFLCFLFSVVWWILLGIFSWYIKHVPDRRLPLTTLLSGNQPKFYQWLSGFLRNWFKSSLIWTGIIAVGEGLLGGIAFMVSILLQIPIPFNMPLVLVLGYPTTVVGLLLGFSSTKMNEWDALFFQAETSAKLLVGASEYETMNEDEQNRIKRNVVDSMIGINKATIVVAGGQIQVHNPPAGDLARFGGTGVLIVQEGHAVVLERGGRRSRIVGTGIHHLEMFERVNMVVPLTLRSDPIAIKKMVTQDKVVVEEIKLTVFSKVDAGDRSHTNGAFPFEERIITELIWSPKPEAEVYNWSGAIKSVTDTAMRDVLARLLLDELVIATGGARERLRDELITKINSITKDKLGIVVVTIAIGEIIIPEPAKDSLLARWLADVNRRTTLINAVRGRVL
jgi:hypothetical protein